MAIPAALLPRASVAPVMMWVDGYLGEQHELSVQKTQYPVESGASIVDHALVSPQRVTLNGFVSDLVPAPHADRGLPGYARASAAWEALVALAQEREPIDIVTMLGTYESMLLTSLSTPVQASTGRGMKFTATFEELTRTTTLRGESPPRSGLATDLAEPLNLGRQQSTTVSGGGAIQLLTVS